MLACDHGACDLCCGLCYPSLELTKSEVEGVLIPNHRGDDFCRTFTATRSLSVQFWTSAGDAPLGSLELVSETTEDRKRVRCPPLPSLTSALVHPPPAPSFTEAAPTASRLRSEGPGGAPRQGAGGGRQAPCLQGPPR